MSEDGNYGSSSNSSSGSENVMPSLDSNYKDLKKVLESFRCIICWRRPNNPCLCAKCSKLFCFNCVMEWMENDHKKCPHCMVRLAGQDIVRLRWYDDIEYVLDASLALTKKRAIPVLDQDSNCSLHSKPAKLYCFDCKFSICTDCTDEFEHSDHTYRNLCSVYQIGSKKVLKELDNVKNYLGELKRVESAISTNMDEIKSNGQNMIEEIQNLTIQETTKIQTKIKDSVDILENRLEGVRKKIETVEMGLETEEEVFRTSSKTDILRRQNEVHAKCQRMMAQHLTEFDEEPIDPRFQTSLIPSVSEETINLKRFSKADEKIVFDWLKDNFGFSWKMEILKKDYLEVSFQLMDGVAGQYVINISIIHPLEETRKLNYDIQEAFRPMNFGQTHLTAKVSDLEDQNYIVQDNLRLKVSIKPPNVLKEVEYFRSFAKVVDFEDRFVVPEYSSKTLEINNFRGFIFSNPLEVSTTFADHIGFEWHISTFINKPYKELQCSFELIDGFKGPYQFRILVPNNKGHDIMRTIETDVDDKVIMSIGTISQFLNEDYVKNNILKVKFSVRPKTCENMIVYQRAHLMTPSFEMDFVVDNFREKQSSTPKNNYISSPWIADEFGDKWSLMIYPNGNSRVDTDEALSIFIKRDLVAGISARFDYFIELINKDSKKSIKKTSENIIFQNYGWGFSRFVELSKLNDGFLDPENDSLHLKFSATPSSIKDKLKILNHLKPSVN